MTPEEMVQRDIVFKEVLAGMRHPGELKAMLPSLDEHWTREHWMGTCVAGMIATAVHQGKMLGTLAFVKPQVDRQEKL